MKYDYVTLYNKVSGAIAKRPRLLTFIRIFNKVCTLLFIAVYVGFFVYALLRDFATLALVRILSAPALALLSVTVLRYAIDRPRPYSERGAGITPLHNKKSQSASFPSRHTTCAFVIAVTILPYALWLGLPLLLLSFALAFTRFALGLHYPSDIAVGAFLGALCAIIGILLL